MATFGLQIFVEVQGRFVKKYGKVERKVYKTLTLLLHIKICFIKFI